MKLILLFILGFNTMVYGTFDRNDTTGIVSDSITTLEWQDNYDDNSAEVKSVTSWSEAITYCHDLNLSNIKGVVWRLPNINELLSLVDDSNANGIDTVFTLHKFDKYWTSTTSFNVTTTALYNDFSLTAHSLELVKNQDDGATTAYVRCVRTGRAGRAGPDGDNN